MKSNAPEKIYIHPDIGGREFLRPWLHRPASNESVEYVRKDAFIEKAVEYISEHVEYYMKKDKTCNVPLCPLFATKSFIEDFKKYMER